MAGVGRFLPVGILLSDRPFLGETGYSGSTRVALSTRPACLVTGSLVVRHIHLLEYCGKYACCGYRQFDLLKYRQADGTQISENDPFPQG